MHYALEQIFSSIMYRVKSYSLPFFPFFLFFLVFLCLILPLSSPVSLYLSSSTT